MAQPGTLLLVVLGLIFVERMLELVLHRRNAARLATRGAVRQEDDGFWLIVIAQGILLTGTFVEGWAAPWTGTAWWTAPAIVVLVLAQGLRYWAITSLGDFWSVRVVTVPGARLVATGPYRFVPHPNYVAVIVEAIALPLAFGAWLTLLIAFPLMLIALARRIRREDAALDAARA